MGGVDIKYDFEINKSHATQLTSGSIRNLLWQRTLALGCKIQQLSLRVHSFFLICLSQ